MIREEHFENTEFHALELHLRASLERSAGNLDAARTHATHALRIIEEQFGDLHHRLADTRTLLAYIELEAGNHASARRLIERAREVKTTVPADRGLASFVLARVLSETQGASEDDRARAMRLARSALADYEQAPPHARDRAEVRAWIEAHPVKTGPTP